MATMLDILATTLNTFGSHVDNWRQPNMTVQEYAHQHNVSDRTVYRWIEEGKLKAEKHQGTWIIIVDDTGNHTEHFGNHGNESNQTDQLLRQQIEQLQSENEYLRQELSQARTMLTEDRQRAEEDRQRSDTIIMQLTKQLEKQTFLLEDLRHRSLWRRVKTALGFGQRTKQEQVWS